MLSYLEEWRILNNKRHREKGVAHKYTEFNTDSNVDENFYFLYDEIFETEQEFKSSEYYKSIIVNERFGQNEKQ